MKPNIRITAARLAALLVLVALLSAGVQAAMAAEQTLNVGIGVLQSLSCSEKHGRPKGGEVLENRYFIEAEIDRNKGS